MISPTCKTSEMKSALDTLFDRHYPDASNALKRFREHLAAAQLDFDVEASIEVLDSPPQASFPHGLPSFIHYYIYGTQFGTVKTDDSAHAFTSDGIGLNMGCPIRLARALDVLFSLKPEDQNEPLAQIRARKNHFACVEDSETWPERRATYSECAAVLRFIIRQTWQ